MPRRSADGLWSLTPRPVPTVVPEADGRFRLSVLLYPLDGKEGKGVEISSACVPEFGTYDSEAAARDESERFLNWAVQQNHA